MRCLKTGHPWRSQRVHSTCAWPPSLTLSTLSGFQRDADDGGEDGGELALAVTSGTAPSAAAGTTEPDCGTSGTAAAEPLRVEVVVAAPAVASGRVVEVMDTLEE